MKLKKHVGLAILTSLMIGSSNLVVVNANTIDNTKEYPKHHSVGKKAMEKSITELKGSGVLNDEDIKKIDEYNKKLEEKRRDEMKKRRYEVIDNMVNENVISHQKGEKLKQAIDKNIEQDYK